MRKLFTALAAVLLFSVQLYAQKIITGKVTDESGNAIPNVSVTIKETSSGTTTKSDGSFSLSVSGNAKTLVFSSIGKASQEIQIGSNSIISVRF